VTIAVVAAVATASPAAAAPRGLPPGMPPAATRAEPKLPAPKAWPFREGFSRTSGTGRLQRGAFLWTDFLYDDHGAVGFGQSSSPTNLAVSNGTYSYPEGPAAGNGADVFRTGIGLTRRHTWWRVDWNTLVDPRVPIAAFALDTNNDAARGVSDWPGVPGLHSPGIERVLLVSSRGAWLVQPTGRRRVGHVFVDRAARSFVVRIRRSELPPRHTTRVRLATGMANADGNGFAPVDGNLGARSGQPPVYNVSFRRVKQEPARDNYWMEDAQADALTSGDVSAFSAVVRWSQLARRRTTPEPRPRGYSNRWYVSSIEPGQGVVQDESSTGDLEPNFLGRVQPYAVYLPASYTRAKRSRLVWILHSLGVQHNQYGSLNPNLVKGMCAREQTVCATTLGRGPDGWYVDEAELDFFEVWGALARAYRLDPRRTAISGYSMGGFGAYRLGLGYPDLFSQAISLAGPPGIGLRVVRGAGGGSGERSMDTTPMVENARWLPYFIAHGTADELVPFTSVVEHVNEFDRLGYRYRFELYPGEDHLVWATEDGFHTAIEALGRSPRESAPAHVTLSWYPDFSRRDIGIGPTGAWWVRRPLARRGGDGVLARVDAHSHALPERSYTSVASYQPVSRPGGSGEGHGTGTFLGAPGDALADVLPELLGSLDPSLGVRATRSWAMGDRVGRQRSLALELRNVSSLRLPLRRAGRHRGERFTLKVTTDGPVALGLRQLESGRRVRLDGKRAGRAGRHGRLTLRLGAGEHSIAL
jgi:dienelactone hydrolase